MVHRIRKLRVLSGLLAIVMVVALWPARVLAASLEINGYELDADNVWVKVCFSEGVYANSDGTGAVTADNFTLNFSQNGGSVSSVTMGPLRTIDNLDPVGGETELLFYLSLSGGAACGVETIEIKPADGASVFNAAGEAMAASATTGVITLATSVADLADSGMVTAQLPATAAAELSGVCAIGSTGYPTFDAALTAVEEGIPTTIELLQDVTVNSKSSFIPPVAISNRQITIALNGHQLDIIGDGGFKSMDALQVVNSTLTFVGPGTCNVNNPYKDGDGLDVTASTIALTEGAQLHVTGTGNGVRAGVSSNVMVTSVQQTGNNGTAIDTQTGAKVTVQSNVSAKNRAVYVKGVDSFVQVDGSVTSSDSTGITVDASGKVYAKGNVSGAIRCENSGGQVTIDGVLSGAIYIKGSLYGIENTTKPTSKKGYLTYGAADGSATIWLKGSEEPGGPTGTAVWYTRAPLPSPHTIENIRYLNGRYMAVGYNGTLITSIDGETWTKVDLGTDIDRLGGAAYGGGKYVLVGQVHDYASRIFTSDDGMNWREAAAIPRLILSDVAYGNGRFVAVGEAGKVLTSADGDNWTTQVVTYPDNTRTSLLSITFAAGRFVAVGTRTDSGQQYLGNIMTSTDGVDWEFPYSTSDYTLWDVTYGNNLFVAVGAADSGSCLIVTSSDGTDWARATSATSNAQLRSVEWDGSRFIASGFTSTSNSHGITMVSTDGANWTAQPMSQMSSIDAVASNGAGLIVATAGFGNLYTSDDGGSSWTYRTLGTTKTLRDVAWNGSIYVAVGDAGAIQTSPDGQNWTIQESGTTVQLNKVDYLGGQFIAVGKNGTILTSADGVVWEARPTDTSLELKGIAYGTGWYVAVGGDITTDTNPVALYSKDDGKTWVKDSNSGRPFVSVAFGDGVFLAIMSNGHVYKFNRDVITDEFIVTPDTDMGKSGSYPTDIIYGGDKFVAVGGNGEIYMTSDKGKSWTLCDSDLDSDSWGIAYGGGNLVAVGEQGKIMASADGGMTWHLQPSGLPFNQYTTDHRTWLGGVVAGDNCFVAVGENGLILQSASFTISADTDFDDVVVDKLALNIGGSGANSLPGYVVDYLILPTSLNRGTVITWQSDKPEYVSPNGIVTRPPFSAGDQVVRLTATIRKGSAAATKTFFVVVIAEEDPNITDVRAATAALTFDTIRLENTAADHITSNLILPTTGINVTTITWASSKPSIIAADGTVTRPVTGASDETVTLTATITKGTQSVTKTFTLTVKAMPMVTYTVAVNGSYAGTTGAGSYVQGATVTIQAGSRSGYSFAGWSSADGVTFAEPNSATTTFTMPANNVTVIATWRDLNPGGGGSGDSSTPSTPPANQIHIYNRIGGSLTFAGLSMIVPANALPANATLTILKLAATQHGTLIPTELLPRLAGALYEIRSTGTGNLGEQTITVKLPYDPAKIAEGGQPVVHYCDDLTDEWIALETETVQENGQWYAVAQTSHLDKFAVFSTPIPEEPVEELGEEPQDEQTVIFLIIGQSMVQLGDEQLELDVQPYVRAGRTLVPLRFISEALGAQVEWYEANQQVIIRREQQWILLTVGSTRALVSGTPYDLDCAPEVVEPGRTMVPLRFVSEVLGAQVDYDALTGEVRITVLNGDYVK